MLFRCDCMRVYGACSSAEATCPSPLWHVLLHVEQRRAPSRLAPQSELANASQYLRISHVASHCPNISSLADGMTTCLCAFAAPNHTTSTISSQLGVWADSIYCKHTCGWRTSSLVSRCQTIKKTLKTATIFISHLCFVTFLMCIPQKCSELVRCCRRLAYWWRPRNWTQHNRQKALLNQPCSALQLFKWLLGDGTAQRSSPPMLSSST